VIRIIGYYQKTTLPKPTTKNKKVKILHAKEIENLHKTYNTRIRAGGFSRGGGWFESVSEQPFSFHQKPG